MKCGWCNKIFYNDNDYENHIYNANCSKKCDSSKDRRGRHSKKDKAKSKQERLWLN
jgi:hypothetical protein